MCKPFPPPLVRGGVFEVGLETKYRDIADGNFCGFFCVFNAFQVLETKYRDIADGNRRLPVKVFRNLFVGNQVPRYSGWKQVPPAIPIILAKVLETKYRDIADGNQHGFHFYWAVQHQLETKYRDIADGNIRCQSDKSSV